MSSAKHFAFQISYLIETDGQVRLRRTLETRPDDWQNFLFDARAEAVHGCAKETIVSFPPETELFGTLLADIEPFAAERLTVIGYNVDFDIRFLKAVFARCRSDFYKYFDRMHCDVLQLAQNRRIAGLLDLRSITLEKVCAHYGISTEGSHNSMTDITNTREVFYRLMETPIPSPCVLS